MKELCVLVISTILFSEITCLIDRNRVNTCQVSSSTAALYEENSDFNAERLVGLFRKGKDQL